MSIRIVKCPECESKNWKILNSSLKKHIITRQEFILVEAKCNSCKHEFKYDSVPEYLKKPGVLY
ncbi:MAG: hypothetical protein E6R13_05905 [Spirochaetes bacterium]|nr:MAG: hypothetical protein E6R13_05905 [Spirochaetota bacterium]